jgi:Uma2 family endonuclease
MLQAKGFEVPSSPSYKPPHVPVVNPFLYGWRYVKKLSPTGEELDDPIPLTAEDLLNPQLGDQVPQRNAHFQAILDLASCLKTHYAKDPTVGVFGDLIMDWGIPGLPGPAPDLAIIPNLKHKEADRGTFKVVDEGTRPGLVIEVTSPGYSGDETKKVEIYAKAGIPEYFLIKPHTERDVPYYEPSGYRLDAGVYLPLAPDAQGRWFCQTLQLWFELEDQGRMVRVTDARTGKRLLMPVETEAARLVAEARAEAEAQARLQTEVARQQEQAGRLAAEAQARALETRLRELEKLLKSRS